MKYVKTVATLVALVITLVTVAATTFNLTSQPKLLRLASLLGYVVFSGGVVWFAFFEREVRQLWRWLSLAVLYLITIPYFVWVGTWIGATGPSVSKDVFPIERASVQSGIYEGVENPDVGQGSGYVVVASNDVDGEFYTSYQLYYSLPTDGDAYAGVSLWFPEPQDLSEYNFIELTISFGDDQARCKLFLKDSFDGWGSVVLGDDTIVSAAIEEQTAQIPLRTYFPSVAKKSVRKIDIDVNNQFTQGEHSLTVSRIRFRK